MIALLGVVAPACTLAAIAGLATLEHLRRRMDGAS